MRKFQISKKYISHFGGMHLLRFFLSISILIVHFPHFFIGPHALNSPEKNALPFYNLFNIIYSYGGFAVEIFWMISGIVFFIFYEKNIRKLKTSFDMFLVNRVSRLYPLHFITLILMAVLQYYYFKWHDGKYFIYQNNDAFHFILNLLTINFWNPKFGLSFNGPFWSVSVEIFVYLVFFLAALSGLLRIKKCIAGLIIFFFISYCLGILTPFYECLLYFFVGVMIAFMLDFCITWKFIGGTLIVILMGLFFRYQIHFLTSTIEIKRVVDILIKMPVSIALILIFLRIFGSAPDWMYKKMMYLGNITYGIYMVHIPLQLFILLAFYERWNVFFNTKLFFILWILVSIILGSFLYKIYEMPAQKYIRNLFERYKLAPKL